MKPALVILLFLSLGCTSVPKALADTPYIPCAFDTSRQAARATELAALVKGDQDDREDWQKKTPAELAEVTKRDLERRKRVGEIFGEGCFKTAADYGAAALVYQHGDIPDHYFQTFIWAKRAVELGDVTQSSLVAKAIDRYLINVGQKQLFGTQADRPGPTEATCWCLAPIEPSFPESMRKQYRAKSRTEVFDWLKELNQGKSCPNTECPTALKPSPKGTVPGFW